MTLSQKELFEQRKSQQTIYLYNPLELKTHLKLLRSNHMNLYLIYCGQEHRKRIKKAHKSPICPIRSTKKARKHFERLAISSRSHFMQQNQKFMCSPYLPFNSRFICVII